MAYPCLVGRKFGLLTVVDRCGTGIHGGRLWSCLCDCGKKKKATSSCLIKGVTSSCGCTTKAKRREATIRNNTTHNMTGTPIYRTWYHMRERCEKEYDKSYKYYGDRGIKCDPKWISFENFFADMGDTWKKGLSLDRIDNNKGYSKDNCRWATQLTQVRNTRRNIYITVNEKTRCLSEWCELLGLPYRKTYGKYRREPEEVISLVKNHKIAMAI